VNIDIPSRRSVWTSTLNKERVAEK